MKQVFVKFAPHLINLIKLFAVRRNWKFKINKAQDKLKTFKGVFNYDPVDEK